MKKKLVMRITAVCMAVFMATAPISASAATILKVGSSGKGVKTVQSSLKELGYYKHGKLTGYYGDITKSAVKRFQKENGAVADGIVGKKTLALLNSAVKETSDNKSTKGEAVKAAKVENESSSTIKIASIDTSENMSGDLDWFKEVKYIWGKGKVAIVTDVDTGKSFEVKRTYGSNHADVEPLTKEDTKIIKNIWGGFTWERRAVVVQVNGYTIAASMTAMPHAGVDSIAANRYVRNRSAGYGYGINLDAVKGNGCSGVMDIHFKNSRTHSTNRKQSSQQNMVGKAADFIESLAAEL
ncbi:MAG: Zinc D-Ala-D-Ala carboxypeptidase precursor [Herbinix sp.]|jgi:peptidoglycan hydrolase-like protein with peptidoglycan-binding domain|nr:Zinc D-Ala-D-Ala carboxypeptidase precursor [Herbinix sp.]